MPKIFLSHASRDKVLANTLAIELRQALGFVEEDIFVSSEPDDIRSGKKWLDEVLVALNKSEIIIPLITPSSEKSMWVAFEYGHFWGRKDEQHIFPIIHPKAEIPSPLNSLQAKRVTSKAELSVFFSDVCNYFKLRIGQKADFDAILESAKSIPVLSAWDIQRQLDNKIKLAEISSLEAKKIIISSMNSADILHDADLTWLQENGGLNGVAFTSANMEATDLGGSYLRDASFWSANLTHARLGSTQLQGADFQNANLNGASFEEAELNENTTLPDGSKYNPQLGLKQLLRFGAVIDH